MVIRRSSGDFIFPFQQEQFAHLSIVQPAPTSYQRPAGLSIYEFSVHGDSQMILLFFMFYCIFHATVKTNTKTSISRLIISLIRCKYCN